MEPVPYGSINHSSAPKLHKSANRLLILLLIIFFAGIASAAVYFYVLNTKKTTTDKTSNQNPTSHAHHADHQEAESSVKFSIIEQAKQILSNGHADPAVLKTDTGYRMYINQQSSNPTGIMTYISTDGVTWTKEQEVFISGASTSRAVRFPDGIRLYYPDAQPLNQDDEHRGILSSFSQNGQDFSSEGVVIAPTDNQHYLEGPTVFQLKDGSWRMYFNENTIAASNNRDGVIWGASSTDGKAWVRDASPTLTATEVENTYKSQHAPWDQVLHPFVIANPKGGYIMFYNSHSEIFAAISEDGYNWEKVGGIGVHGADLDGYFVDDETMRIYYGDFSQETGGLVYTATLKIEQ